MRMVVPRYRDDATDGAKRVVTGGWDVGRKASTDPTYLTDTDLDTGISGGQ
jgi:hypothetical protein